jgi:hypothetical protein
LGVWGGGGVSLGTPPSPSDLDPQVPGRCTLGQDQGVRC